MSCIECVNPVTKSFCCFVVIDEDAELDAGPQKRRILPAVVQECLTFNKGTKEGEMEGNCLIDCGGQEPVPVPGCKCSVDTLEMSGCLIIQVAVPIKGIGILTETEPNNCEAESYVCCTNKVCIEEPVPVCVSCSDNNGCITPPDVCPTFSNLQFRELPQPGNNTCPKKVYKITGDVSIDVTCIAPTPSQ